MSAPPKYRQRLAISQGDGALKRTDADRHINGRRKPLRTLDELFDPKIVSTRQSLWRARSGMEVVWECVRCKATATEWLDAIPSKIPAHDCQHSFYCPTCDLPQVALIPKAWRQRAEERREHALYSVGLWDFSRKPYVPKPPDTPKPPPIRPRAIEREVTMDLIRYFLSDRKGDDLVGLLARSYLVPDPGWDEDAQIEGGELLVPFPQRPDLQVLLLALLPDVAAEHAQSPYPPGHPICISDARKALAQGCWWPAEARKLSDRERAQTERIHREVIAEQQAPTPEPDTEAVAVPNPNPPAVIEEPAPLDPLIAAYQAGDTDTDTDTEVEWFDDDDTHPGVIVEGEE